MLFTLVITVFLGLAAVLQGGLNRRVAAVWGLPAAVLFNNAVLMVCALVFLAVSARWAGTFPEEFRHRGFSRAGFAAWFLLPGLFGFAIVAGVPYAIQKIGAASLFIGLIGAQLVGGFVWDAVVEKIPVTPVKIAAGVLALASVILASREK